MADSAASTAASTHAFLELPDLAAERVGGAVVWANDEFFAEKENLLKAAKAVFIEGKYTDRGKWMDGWETRRRRVPGHDACIVRLGLGGIVRGVVVDTAFFRGNFPQACSIEGAAVTGQPTVEELLGANVSWTEILPRSELRGDSANVFTIASEARFTHLRFNIFPDGGVARLRVHGDVVPHPRFLGRPGAEIDLAALEHGAKVVRANDMFFGSRHNLILPGPSLNMGDGWETRRSRKEAPDWAIVELAAEGTIDRLEIDTSHFKGNFPESAAVHGIRLTAGRALDSVREEDWSPVLARTKLQAHTRHHYEAEIEGRGPFTHLRLRIYPDGGIARFRAFGAATTEGRADVALRHLRLASEGEKRSLWRATCGAQKFVERMQKVGCESFDDVRRAANEAFDAFGRDDWLEAFRAHPRIGEKKAKVDTGARAGTWSGGEQAGVHEADAETRAELAAINDQYENRFGFVYIVCATGRTAVEMLAFAKQRMTNDPAAEINVAAAEQRKITALRIDKLLGWT